MEDYAPELRQPPSAAARKAGASAIPVLSQRRYRRKCYSELL